LSFGVLDRVPQTAELSSGGMGQTGERRGGEEEEEEEEEEEDDSK